MNSTTFCRLHIVDRAFLAVGLRPGCLERCFGDDGLYSHRLTDPAATQFPAPVEVRKLSLAGHTLT